MLKKTGKFLAKLLPIRKKSTIIPLSSEVESVFKKLTKCFREKDSDFIIFLTSCVLFVIALIFLYVVIAFVSL